MQPAQMLALAMLLGSIPFGYIAVYVRNQGLARDSGGTLANIRRVWGPVGLVVVIALNVTKGFLPVYLTRIAIPVASVSIQLGVLVGIIAILSHCYPYWFMFRKTGWGGSVAIGALLGLLLGH